MSNHEFLSMCILQEFDLQCRGAVELADEWKHDHRNVQAVWGAEDLVRVLRTCGLAANETCGQFISGQQPELTVFYYFKSKADRYIVACSEFLSEVTDWAAQNGYTIEGVPELRASIAALTQDLAIAESKMSSAEDAEWASLEQDAMPSARIDSVVEYLKKSGQASA